ncbi:MAG: succinate dehydrogenase assembly factor 2 [Candidatus Moranbacteria bacterium]|jgi:antitoxin CptB|nr:succinate dehydrogenase assembly factor 2 [Candidatus Moranbacteria bacterium]
MSAQVEYDPTALLDARVLSKLHWRCRRGLLENDLFIEQFFLRHESELTSFHAEGMGALMDLADNDLLDLLLRRKEPTGALDQSCVHTVLDMLRQSGGTPA